MIIVAHQHAGMYPKTGLRAGFAQLLQESLPVLVVLENLLSVTATGQHAIHRARILEALCRIGAKLFALARQNEL